MSHGPHPTPQEILRYVDASADYANTAILTNHLAVCPMCRREVDFQRQLVKAIRRVPVTEPGPNFVPSVMRMVLPSLRSRLAFRVLNNLGSVFGLIMVLSAGGILYKTITSTQIASQSPTVLTPSERFEEVIKVFVTSGLEAYRSLPVESAAKFIQGIPASVVWSVTTLIVLLLIDQLISKRAIHRMRGIRS